MRLLRKTSSKPSGRQRIRESEQQLGTAYAYHSRRAESEPALGRHEQRPSRMAASKNFGRFWLQRFGLAVLLIVAVISGINVIGLAPNALILPSGGNSIQTNSFLRPQSDYQAAANKLLTKSIWSRTKLTISTAQIDSSLLRQFPELADVSTTLPLIGHRPVIHIQSAEPAFIMNATNGSFVIDNRGKALLLANSSEAVTSLKLVTLTDQSGLRIQLNRQALTSQDVAFIQTVIAELQHGQVPIASMTLPAAASELDLQPTGQPYFIKFNLQSTDARQQAGTFLATMAQLQRQKVTPKQYVDVRVDGRAYYK